MKSEHKAEPLFISIMVSVPLATSYACPCKYEHFYWDKKKEKSEPSILENTLVLACWCDLAGYCYCSLIQTGSRNTRMLSDNAKGIQTCLSNQKQIPQEWSICNHSAWVRLVMVSCQRGCWSRSAGCYFSSTVSKVSLAFRGTFSCISLWNKWAWNKAERYGWSRET